MNIDNTKIENIEYFGNYLGKNYGVQYSDKYKREILQLFTSRRKKVRSELRSICNVSKWEKRISTIKGYHSKRELDYMVYIGTGNYLSKNNCSYTKDIEYPLVWLNRDYRNSKIHVLELELCYLNRNIKNIKQELRSKKSC